MRQLFVLLLVMFVGQVAADETHGWAVVYLNTEVNPYMSYAMVCTDFNPNCNTVYQDVERTIWFPTRALAFDFINGFYVQGPLGGPLAKFYANSNEPVLPKPMDDKKIVGVYRCERIVLNLKKIGTHHEQVSEVRDKEVDTMQWQ